ncbi:hypothetical protein [Cronobacter phage EspYZU12]|nr:hypothetical protein EspYZU15_208 [Cronobacter phage EspYZU15]WAK45616.1 hypothetical protein EspYZU14_212 [Cronobacter phage EspYZU14]WBF78400.1 hypothetical protein [Cronobacter phage EspYZU12]
MNKVDVSVVPVDWPSGPVFDPANLKDDKTTRDLIAYMERQRMIDQHSMWDTHVANGRDRHALTELFENVEMLRATHDPLMEMGLLFLKCLRQEGTFSWMWSNNVASKNPLEERFLARMEADVRERPEYNNPFESDNVVYGNLEMVIRGHGNGKSLLNGNVWPFSGRTREFIRHISPLVSGLGCGEDLRLVIEYRKYRNRYTYSDNRSTLDFQNVGIVVGDLMIYHDFKLKNELDRLCNRIDHTVLHVRHRKLKVKNAREAMFVCNKYENMFHFEYDPKLRAMMLGSTPTEEELLMMEMAGYKDEFWLDKIESFDRLRIKPFNLMESQRWFEQNIPKFRF